MCKDLCDGVYNSKLLGVISGGNSAIPLSHKVTKNQLSHSKRWRDLFENRYIKTCEQDLVGKITEQE